MNGGKEVVDAFLQKYGIDLRKANAVSSSCIEVKKPPKIKSRLMRATRKMPLRRGRRKYTIDRKTGNIVHCRGRKIMQYSVDFFVNKIATGQCCFMCGRPYAKEQFTDEHVIPRWVTRHFGTEKSFMRLHNGGKLYHARNTVPCCLHCNSWLSETLEKPVSALLKLSYDELLDAIDRDPAIYHLLFQWCALIFFKPHMKDQFLPQIKDPRANKGMIGDLHAWQSLHQVLSVARIKYSGAKVDPRVYGSIIVLPRLLERNELSDYLDCSTAHTMMIQAGEIVIFAVLNDNKACLSKYRTLLSSIDGPMTEVQCRELFARLRYLNDNLKTRPGLRALVNRRNQFLLQPIRPWRIELYEEDQQKVSLFSLMRTYIGELIPDVPQRAQILSDLENGRAQYILDADGRCFCYADRLRTRSMATSNERGGR